MAPQRTRSGKPCPSSCQCGAASSSRSGRRDSWYADHDSGPRSHQERERPDTGPQRAVDRSGIRSRYLVDPLVAVSEDGPVQWDGQTREGVDTALNEADVLGVRLDPSGAWCDLLLHVLALPLAGPTDPDARRVLRLISPARVAVVLREERVVPREERVSGIGFGPVIPLAGLAAVEEFFASLTWSGSMYGWKFLDDPSLTRDCLAEPCHRHPARARVAQPVLVQRVRPDRARRAGRVLHRGHCHLRGPGGPARRRNARAGRRVHRRGRPVLAGPARPG